MNKYDLNKAERIINKEYSIENLLQKFSVKRTDKGSGKNKYYLCPFHDDKIPSMSVSMFGGIERVKCWSNNCQFAGRQRNYIQLYNALQYGEFKNEDKEVYEERLIRLIESNEQIKKQVLILNE